MFCSFISNIPQLATFSSALLKTLGKEVQHKKVHEPNLANGFAQMNVYTHTSLPSSQWGLAQSQRIDRVILIPKQGLESRGRKISEFLNWNSTTEIVLTENSCPLNLFLMILYADLINTMQHTWWVQMLLERNNNLISFSEVQFSLLFISFIIYSNSKRRMSL